MENQIYENICLRRNCNERDVYRAILGKIALEIERANHNTKSCESVVSQITAILQVNDVDTPTPLSKQVALLQSHLYQNKNLVSSNAR
jgi:hypothetical protein